MWECELWVCNLNICTTQQYSFSQSSLVRTLLSYFCCLCASRINCTDVWWTAHRFMSTQLLATDHAEPILNVIMIFIFLASYLSLLKIRADTWSARSVFSITVFFFECYCFIQRFFLLCCMDWQLEWCSRRMHLSFAHWIEFEEKSQFFLIAILGWLLFQ